MSGKWIDVARRKSCTTRLSSLEIQAPTSAADVGDAVNVPPPVRAVLGGELLEL
eukprot:CAMPEP_0183389930 /NCGR_PEP_ID=MMETSP0370-20130417/5272_1 /TAXON_ID=268820 /ORGANISM="Peridinium aciculiferum, Strain PAER-2" /LENGTH=53 /DNA_ID=CAMNT_0025569295 /DNA_START=90 /DNA_END=248 /DNA_ORIENTATION=+